MMLHCTAERSCNLLSILRRELRLSSTLVKQLKQQSAFFVNGLPAFTDHPVEPGDGIDVRLAVESPGFPPEEGPLDILYEDEALLAVDKPPGLLVHPTASRNTGTLANRVACYLERTGQHCGVHTVTRLDRDTFGVCLLAKHAHIHALLGRAQADGLLQKTYRAAVAGLPAASSGVISLPIARRSGGSLLREPRQDGQAAKTEYRVLACGKGASLLELLPVTGRTHQLRVHCTAMGFPILGDQQYGTPASLALSADMSFSTQQLWAYSLCLSHPLRGQSLTIISRQRPRWPEVFSFDG